MERSYLHWHSPVLGRKMEMLVFGHGGAAVLVFPTSAGRFYQYEDFGMVEALSHHLNQGWIQLFCVDSVDGESWYDTRIHPHDRAVRHEQYDAYLVQEVVPFIRSANPSNYLIVTGNSFGAYHSVNFTLRHPELVNRVIGISGNYNAPLLNGYYDDVVYYNSPVDYLPNLGDERYLWPLRNHVDLRVVVGGPDDMCHKGTLRLARIMSAKGLPHTLDIWDQAWHDWPWWRQMILKHI